MKDKAVYTPTPCIAMSSVAMVLITLVTLALVLCEERFQDKMHVYLHGILSLDNQWKDSYARRKFQYTAQCR